MINDAMKNKIIFGLVALLVIFIAVSIASYSRANQQKSAKDKEILTRLDIEEKLSKFMQDKSSIDAKLTALSKELEAERENHASTKKMLLQEQLINESLKNELQKVSKLKETLEEDLRNALAAASTPKPKK
jgi:hypothetical protein